MRSVGDTICAIATPVGQGAIGVVRLSGPRALELLQRAARGWPRRAEPRRQSLVKLYGSSGRVVDRVLASWHPAPRSYTGEEVVEVSAHGGRLNVQRVLDLFLDIGARLAEPGEFTRRAFVNGRLDLIQAEAVAEVIAARSGRALRNAQALLDGTLGRRVRAALAAVVKIAAELEACIDFADEPDVAAATRTTIEEQRGLAMELEVLAGSYGQGRRLGGVEVALVGAVNAGKSSLFNAIVGRQRALVSEEKGTTRDYLEELVPWGELLVTLVDTAGAQASGDASLLERQGRALGVARARECDAVIEVVDLAAGPPVERMPVETEEGRLVLVAANKVDLLAPEVVEARLRELGTVGRSRAVAVSALRGDGLKELGELLVRELMPEEGVDEAAETLQVTSERHYRGLRSAASSLRDGSEALERGEAPELVVEHVREALAALGEITGDRVTEDVLDAVFSRFCIGK